MASKKQIKSNPTDVGRLIEKHERRLALREAVTDERPSTTQVALPDVAIKSTQFSTSTGINDPGDTERVNLGRVMRTLRDALGDLYGSGTRAKFIRTNGKIEWAIFSECCGLDHVVAKRAAGANCRMILREIEDYVLSHRDPVERYLHERRLGIRR